MKVTVRILHTPRILILLIYWDYIGIMGLYRDAGKENGNYYIGGLGRVWALGWSALCLKCADAARIESGRLTVP